MEERETLTKAVVAVVYQASTIGNVSQTDSIVLHHARVDEIFKWA
jgi:hypothetical protein